MAETQKEQLVTELTALIESPAIIPALSENSDRDAVDEELGEEIRGELMDGVDRIAYDMLRCDSLDAAQECFEEHLGDVFAEVVTACVPSYSNISYLLQEAVRISSGVKDILQEIGFAPGMGLEDE
jgi:hypothetical protein